MWHFTSPLTPADVMMELDRKSRLFLAQENILHQFVHFSSNNLFNLLDRLEGGPFNVIQELKNGNALFKKGERVWLCCQSFKTSTSHVWDSAWVFGRSLSLQHPNPNNNRKEQIPNPNVLLFKKSRWRYDSLHLYSWTTDNCSLLSILQGLLTERNNNKECRVYFIDSSKRRPSQDLTPTPYPVESCWIAFLVQNETQQSLEDSTA